MAGILVTALDLLRRAGRRRLRRRHVRQRRVLGHRVGDVDPEPVDATVEPEPQDRVELVDDLRVVPVEVRLGDVEQVQVPLAVLDPLPGGPAERSRPVRRWDVAGGPLAVAEPEPVALRRTLARGKRRLEPRVLPGAVVRHQVDQHPQAELVRLLDQVVGVVEGAELRVDVAVVGHVVPAVEQRGGVPRADPDRVHAQVGEVRQPGADAVHVADAVAVGVGERARVDLVDDGAAPPVVGRSGPSCIGRCIGHAHQPFTAAQPG
jgi:hypothetical protein